jgi:archaellum biogenesis ATPase FlaH
VFGSSGVGKTILSFLFIRVLLELEVPVCVHSFSSFDVISLYFNSLQVIWHLIKNLRLMFSLKNKILTITVEYTSEEHRKEFISSQCTCLWNPKYFFLPNDIINALKVNKKVPTKWIILDEFEFF